MGAISNRINGLGGRADDLYEALIRGHEGLGDEESDTLNARLVLVLAGELGDLDRLTAAIALARSTLRPDTAGPEPVEL